MDTVTAYNGVAGRRITTREATLHTATISVKTLTLDKRQVTLSVFRQLQEEPLLLIEGDSVSLAGVPWGRVNYCPGEKNCRGVTAHMHVVWQSGDELRRAAVAYEPDLKDRQQALASTVLLWLEGRYRLDDHASREDAAERLGFSVYSGFVNSDKVHIRGTFEGIELNAYVGPVNWPRGTDPRVVHGEAAGQAGRIRSLCARYASQVEALNDLDQLFIAV